MIGLRSFYLEESDRRLIRRFARLRDNRAFSIIMGRYADMVYTTCRRVLGDEAQAADAAQETFFDLVKKADGITGSVGAWLHKVATRRAVDLIRQNVSRRRREAVYVAEAPDGASSWSEVAPVVDEALEALPEDQRELLTRHFLQGRGTVQMAAEQGVSQPTISRRIAEALEGLRQNLRERGIQVGLVPLQTLLLHSNHIAPEALRISLGKIGLVKAAAANSAWLSGAAAPATGIGIKTVVAVATVAVVIGTVGVVWYHHHKVRSAHAARAPVAQGTLNAAVAQSAPGRVDLTPVQQLSASAAQPSQFCAVATLAARRPMPARVPARPPAARSLPSARAAEKPVKGDKAAGTTGVANAQVPAAQRPTAAQPAPLLIVPRRFEGFYPGGVVVRADIYPPLPTARLAVPDWNRGLTCLVALGPGSAGRVNSTVGPAPLASTSPSKTGPGQRYPVRGQ